ncbi:hypothetical protein EXU57_04795 [Segetibacter sp. 3557_3]|uniref:hypothetical protein n=1 Tax=Segetibacter sp. 3557_3 TaxID=2547429 RepID=UPI001058AE1E|nr:hypothetical protein [Segetibacter sp. 3557_3]TDH27793.1 hypothetical protein EXU57_04795 [Segetibacter sp. 3557_3]
MKLSAFLILAVFGTVSVKAQYYYSDIISNQLTNHQYKLIKDNSLKKINAVSYEGNQVSSDFVMEQTISNNARQITIRSASAGSGQSFFTSYFENGLVNKTIDSSQNAINTVTYDYDANGNLIRTLSSSKDFDGTFSSNEEHRWTLNSAGKPESMLKIKNGIDTTRVNFTRDESGNIAEETWTKNKRVIETYYYYYNDQNRLTDIVRFSRKARQMLPDYIFEYDANGRISQMTQAQINSANYLIWKYSYNDKGLKSKELVYNKRKEYMGKIEYVYQ